MPRKALNITAAELRIMKVMWRIGSGTVRQVLEALPSTPGEQPAYTTVMTMLKQLAEKRALQVDRTRQPFVYSPAVTREQVLGTRLTQFLQSVFDGNAEALVLHLVEQDELSPDELKRIETKIRRREQLETEGPSHSGESS